MTSPRTKGIARRARRFVVVVVAWAGAAAGAAAQESSDTRPAAAAVFGPEEAPRFFAAATRARRLGDARAAAAFATAGARLVPDDVAAQKDAARYALEAEDHDAAADFAARALARAPEDGDAWLLRARARAAGRGLAAARDVLAAADRVRRPDAAARRLRAECEAAAGDRRLAEELFLSAGGLDAAAFARLFDAASRDGDAVDARRLLRAWSKAAGGDETEASAAARATAYARLPGGAHDAESLATLRRAVREHPERLAGEDLVRAADALRENGDGATADAVLSAGRAARPRSGVLAAAAAETRRTAGDYAGARRLLEGAAATVDDLAPVRAAIDRLASPAPGAEGRATAFSLGRDGLRRDDEDFPLGAASSLVRLRAVRVAAGSPKAVLTPMPGELSAEHLRRALEALAAAGFTHVRLR